MTAAPVVPIVPIVPIAAGISAHELVFSYPGGGGALDGVSFSIAAGEAVALIGGNGGGKTTLLQHLNGVLRPDSGEVRINGELLTDDNLAAMRRRVGLIFQNADDQLFMPTVQEDVAFGLANSGLEATEIAERTAAALAAAGVAHLAARAPHRLSGGEKRAVAIAGVLAMQPQILVMDEPGDGLDMAARRQLINTLATMQQTRIIATHDLHLVLELCPRVLVMREGRIEADGRPEEIFADAELLQRCRLEAPPLWSPP